MNLHKRIKYKFSRTHKTWIFTKELNTSFQELILLSTVAPQITKLFSFLFFFSFFMWTKPNLHATKWYNQSKLQQQSYAVSKRWGFDNIRKESTVTTNMGFVIKTHAGSNSKERITLWKVKKEGIECIWNSRYYLILKICLSLTALEDIFYLGRICIRSFRLWSCEETSIEGPALHQNKYITLLDTILHLQVGFWFPPMSHNIVFLCYKFSQEKNCKRIINYYFNFSQVWVVWV